MKFIARLTQPIAEPLVKQMLGRLGEREALDRTYTFAGIGIQSALLIHFLHSGWVA
jgi:hypothetical protein